MTREIRFRVWDKAGKRYLENFCVYQYGNVSSDGMFLPRDEVVVEQDTGLKDRNGKPICQGDIIEFTDKWEWYRGSYAIKMMFADAEAKKVLNGQYDSEPMYRFEVVFDPFEGWNLSKSDIANNYYEIIGNVNENPELLSGLAEPKG